MVLGKAELRRRCLEQRQGLSVEEWREKSDRLCDRIQTLPQFRQAKTILAYFSFRREPDLSPLFSDRQTWGFPRCVGDRLSWHQWTPGDPLQVGNYGILEPELHSPGIEAATVDLLLVPAVACDVQGYRLGYGGGFYDRMLSLPEWGSKASIGIVFDFACLDRLPIETWDKPLQEVCTEKGCRVKVP